jgi:predicted membrane chloride channel (bestrophin family)
VRSIVPAVKQCFTADLLLLTTALLLLYCCFTAGACERIVRSNVPAAYSRHTSRFLSIW